jgi:hypothetical protein
MSKPLKPLSDETLPDGYFRAIISDGEIVSLIHRHHFPGGLLTPEESNERDRRVAYWEELLKGTK